MTYSNERAAVLAALLMRHANGNANPYQIAAVVARMQKAARATRLAEMRACNVALTEKQQQAQEMKRNKAQEDINTTLRFLFRDHAEPPTILLGGDPRGACAFLKIPGLPGDGFNSTEGFPIS